MVVAALLFLFVLALSLVGAFVLYVLVERESDSKEAMSRGEAETEVRRDRN